MLHISSCWQMKVAYEAASRRSRKDPPFTPEQQAQVDRAMAEGNKHADAAKKLVSDHVASVKFQTDQLRAQAKRFGVLSAGVCRALRDTWSAS